MLSGSAEPDGSDMDGTARHNLWVFQDAVFFSEAMHFKRVMKTCPRENGCEYGDVNNKIVTAMLSCESNWTILGFGSKQWPEKSKEGGLI
jgi:hypothetical protein